jgi:hypothetical protein
MERRTPYMGPTAAAAAASGGSNNITAAELLRKETPTPSLSFQLYSHANPPLSLSLRGGSSATGGNFAKTSGDMLPADYREPVATLPPIATAGGGAVAGAGMRQAGCPDLIDLVGFPLGRVRSGGGGGGGSHQRSAVEGENTQQDSYA